MSWFKKTPTPPAPKPPRFRIVENVTRNGRSRFDVEEYGRVSGHSYLWVADFGTAKAAREFINNALGREVTLTRIEGYYGATEGHA
ncbi:hypothetical protein [Streptomyces sp. AC495_CC817]|uniref:hypothetical protein n=1 Tax=Streptomyces sp. AC495_CC817 TaxID=2823900 RepID=UPI001C25EFCF|nr:hypothetical protein [Streptomyces sp. AC495_CC817]